MYICVDILDYVPNYICILGITFKKLFSKIDEFTYYKYKYIT